MCLVTVRVGSQAVAVTRASHWEWCWWQRLGDGREKDVVCDTGVHGPVTVVSNLCFCIQLWVICSSCITGPCVPLSCLYEWSWAVECPDYECWWAWWSFLMSFLTCCPCDDFSCQIVLIRWLRVLRRLNLYGISVTSSGLFGWLLYSGVLVSPSWNLWFFQISLCLDFSFRHLSWALLNFLVYHNCVSP